MTVEELIKAAKERSMTPEAIEAFKQRQAQRQIEWEEWERSQRDFDYDFRYKI